jgi:hypothetical protein
MDGCINGWMDRFINELMNRWVDGLIDGLYKKITQ